MPITLTVMMLESFVFSIASVTRSTVSAASAMIVADACLSPSFATTSVCPAASGVIVKVYEPAGFSTAGTDLSPTVNVTGWPVISELSLAITLAVTVACSPTVTVWVSGRTRSSLTTSESFGDTAIIPDAVSVPAVAFTARFPTVSGLNVYSNVAVWVFVMATGAASPRAKSTASWSNGCSSSSSTWAVTVTSSPTLAVSGTFSLMFFATGAGFCTVTVTGAEVTSLTAAVAANCPGCSVVNSWVNTP